uniref:NB-ARC domain-containing protein n=1 Tax=Hordeum vulgare subsp. vulgare TaxID=112509 RepID=A0A8I6X7N7_HORVV
MDLKEGVMGSVLSKMSELLKEEHDLPHRAKEVLKYLVVIDDLWNEDDWHSISSSLPNNDCASRVITTTRVNDIAMLCCSGCDESIYEVHYLGYQNSRELFYKHYFHHADSWPEAPGDIFLFAILKMCSGTPSAIKRIASLLITKVTPKKQWQEMMYSVYFSWKQTPRSLGSEAENIAGFKLFREIISIIYDDLPGALKDCLLYLAVHAKNQIIHKTSMGRKWIAEGFISENVRHGREEVASRYFDELINRNFIRLSEYDNYSREEKYEVNQMVLYVLRQISNEEKIAAVLSDVGIFFKGICSLFPFVSAMFFWFRTFN